MPNDPSPHGLTKSDVADRRARGLGNNIETASSRSYRDILVENVFTFINNVLFGLGISLVLLGRPSDAVVSVFVILVNVIISVAQEVRAKLTLDRIALLTRPKAIALRDGKTQEIDPAEIVQGDALVVSPGDQVLVDGQMIGDGHIDVDESLLTGEFDLVVKRSGDPVLSGSFCVSGSGIYEAQKVGAQSFANQLTASARSFRRMLTPLQKEINLVIRIILLIAISFEVLFVIRALLDGTPVVESVKMSVVIAGLVPNGLLLTIAVAYALGAVRIAGKGALVQQSNAVESLSHVDTLCLDKTGTLTTNQLRMHTLEPIDVDEVELRNRIGEFVASFSDRNRTAQAVAEACPREARGTTALVPFSSARKWSALAFNDEHGQGTYLLGAPEVIKDYLSDLPGLDERIAAYSRQGLRVVLFASLPQAYPLQDSAGEASLPAGFQPLGLVVISDTIRHDAMRTLAAFEAAGVQVKVISGDGVGTVLALARQAGMPESIQALSGTDMKDLDEDQLALKAEETTIFGRITPQQKEQLVRALRKRGHYVAMIGDGINDVLSLKQADLGIAMQSGSQAARSVADIVLLGDSFASLVPAVKEGQRILNGMQDIIKLYMTRALYVAFLIISVGVLNAFPFSPKENSLLALFTVGIPTLALAIWARPLRVPRGSLVRHLVRFVFPAVVTSSFFALGVFVTHLVIISGAGLQTLIGTHELAYAQTAMTSFNVIAGLILVVFAEPPIEALAGGDELSDDWRPTILVGILYGMYSLILVTPSLRDFFELSAIGFLDYLSITAVAILWAALLSQIWRRRWVERFLDVNEM